MKKLYLYHITENDWGKSVTLIPKSTGDNRDSLEPKTPRICTATTIAGCMIAVYLNQLNTVNVYRTRHKVDYKYPRKVRDSKITDERWITKPTEFILIRNLDDLLERTLEQGLWVNTYMGELGDGKENSEKWQRETKQTFQNILDNS
jgi:hypothetical protein